MNNNCEHSSVRTVGERTFVVEIRTQNVSPLGPGRSRVTARASGLGTSRRRRRVVECFRRQSSLFVKVTKGREREEWGPVTKALRVDSGRVGRFLQTMYLHKKSSVRCGVKAQ